jgi:hypothetical protein
MIGIADFLAAVIAAGVRGDELVMEEQELIGIELEGQSLRSVKMRDRIAVGNR